MARPRGTGTRESNGRIQRPTKQEREAARVKRELGERATVANQPHRRGNLDQRCSSELGRYCMARSLRTELLTAGEEYAATIRRWRAAKGVPEPFSTGGKGSGLGPDDEAVGRLESRMKDMRGSVKRDGGALALKYLDMVVLDDTPAPGPQAFRVTSALMSVAISLGYLRATENPWIGG